MNYQFNFLSVLIFCFSVYSTEVKVLLQTVKKPSWKMSCNRGFTFYTTKKNTFFPTRQTSQHITISVSNNLLSINNTPVKSDILTIKPIGSETSFLNNSYSGYFYICKIKKEWYLINIVDSEEYLFSVLDSESWPGWPLEINKVLAITSRSYLLYQLMESRKKKLVYDIKNNNFHQCYNGTHQSEVIRKAIEQTRGIFLGHNNKPILAMFDISCGGVIPSYIDGVVDFKKAPYLARTYPCTFCKESKSYNWQISYSFDVLKKYLQEGTDDILSEFKDIKVTHKDKAGLVKHLSVKNKNVEIVFTARQFYKLLKDVKSFSFNIKKKSNLVIVTGKGFGHHFGLCQWGAYSMVKKGWDYQKVLQFFYPNTTFMRLNTTKDKA